jgi:hypothetical protein
MLLATLQTAGNEEATEKPMRVSKTRLSVFWPLMTLKFLATGTRSLKIELCD